jgi:hypothetical protein
MTVIKFEKYLRPFQRAKKRAANLMSRFHADKTVSPAGEFLPKDLEEDVTQVLFEAERLAEEYEQHDK